MTSYDLISKSIPASQHPLGCMGAEFVPMVQGPTLTVYPPAQEGQPTKELMCRLLSHMSCGGVA